MKRAYVPDVSIDVCLIAIIIAIHITKKDHSLKLALLALLVTHIMCTTDSLVPPRQEAGQPPQQSVKPLHVVVGAPQESSNHISSSEVSSSGFSRQFSAPDQLSKTQHILPTSARGANGKLVDARTRFYEDIIN